jgi:hypothetical protein
LADVTDGGQTFSAVQTIGGRPIFFLADEVNRGLSLIVEQQDSLDTNVSPVWRVQS